MQNLCSLLWAATVVRMRALVDKTRARLVINVGNQERAVAANMRTTRSSCKQIKVISVRQFVCQTAKLKAHEIVWRRPNYGRCVTQ